MDPGPLPYPETLLGGESTKGSSSDSRTGSLLPGSSTEPVTALVPLSKDKLRNSASKLDMLNCSPGWSLPVFFLLLIFGGCCFGSDVSGRVEPAEVSVLARINGLV